MTWKKELIIEYFGKVKNTILRDNFVRLIEMRDTYRDIREDGYICTMCKTLNKAPITIASENTIVFPNGIKEVWRAKTHYCGCRGWD